MPGDQPQEAAHPPAATASTPCCCGPVKVVLKKIEVKKKTNVLWFISATDDEVVASGATRIDRPDAAPLTTPAPAKWPTDEASHGIGEGGHAGTDKDPLQAVMGQVDPMPRPGHPCYIKGAVVVTLWKVSALQGVDPLAKQVANALLQQAPSGAGLLGGIEKLVNDVIDAILHGIGLGTIPMVPPITIELEGDNACDSDLASLLQGQSKTSWSKVTLPDGTVDPDVLTRTATVEGKGGVWEVTLTLERTCTKERQQHH